MSLKKAASLKPDSVSQPWAMIAIIYLSRWLPGGINLPTLYLGRAALKWYFTWHFSMQGLPAIDVAIKSRELLPHVFNLTLVPEEKKAVIFCGTVCSRTNGTRLFTGALLCAVRTFLPGKYRGDSWLAAGQN